MKILISWVAAMHDFLKENNEKGNKVNYDGPTFNFHRHFYESDRHVILCKGNGDDPEPKVELLKSELKKEFPLREIEVRYIDVLDVIDMAEIRSKVEGVLLRDYKDDEIDIFFSPGTSAMQIAWYLIHESAAFATKLYQVRPKAYSRSGKPELMMIDVEKSGIPLSSVIKEEVVGQHIENYKITASLKHIYAKSKMIAAAEQVTTLIYGESGVGKEHLANYIHEKSSRKNHPFIAINCSAFTDELLVSQLFGHKRNSFTGATEDRKGFFEEAKGGTIFLDEIGDISPYMQQSLLRVLQEKKVLGIGYNKEKKVDVRIIAATNKDLPSLCAEGKFRWDLYYRLAVTELTLPPLRERKESERRELIDFFLKVKKKAFKRSRQLLLDKEALRIMLEYPFYGNVRELENLIESLYVFNQDVVVKESLPERLLAPPEEYKLDLETVEKLHIAKVLKMEKNKNGVARTLGITINTLNAKINKYRITS